VLDQVVRHVRPGPIDEARHDITSAIEFCNGLQAVLVEETLHQAAVGLLTNAAIVAVDEVLDPRAVRQVHRPEIAQGVIIIGRRSLS
jgi:hypothetical protein